MHCIFSSVSEVSHTWREKYKIDVDRGVFEIWSNASDMDAVENDDDGRDDRFYWLACTNRAALLSMMLHFVLLPP